MSYRQRIEYEDGSMGMRMAGYDAQDDMMKVKSLQKKWRSDFAGNALNPDKWDVIQKGAGHTVAVAAGELKISTGVTPNTETILQSKETFTDPVRALFGFMVSQRIANQEFYVEFVSVDPDTKQADAQHAAAWRIKYEDYTAAANYGVYEVQNNGQNRLVSGASYLGTLVTGFQILEIEMFSDEVYFHQRAMDAAVSRSASFVRHQQIPDPNALFKVRIRVKNGAVAPASNTDMRFAFVTVVDFAELTAEITAGRGNSSAGQALAVNLTNSPSVYMIQNGTLYAESVANLAANGIYTGASRDFGTTLGFGRLRAIIGHMAGSTPGHLVFEQSSDNVTFRETHRIPVPSDSQYRTVEFPIVLRWGRLRFLNGATAQTLMYLQSTGIRTDGPFDLDKTITFIHSTTALAAATAFTGTTLDLGSNHSINRHRALVFADQPGTLYLEQSRDGVTWRVTQTLNVVANTPAEVEDLVISRYVRARYLNGATANTVFEVQTALVRN